ncbi:MAG: universal stress protein [Nannocystaceae bacterium]|nr:universal stress protein [Nannocystaceae bacterium]
MSTWIVALDLRPSSHGAVRFASWVARAGAQAQDAIALVGVHVIEREQLAPIFRLQSPEEVGRRAREALQHELDEAAIREFFAREKVALGPRAHDVLAHEAASEGATAIVMGRQLAPDDRATVRLGTNARRLLRALPVPVIIVPPDYAKISFGAGPVLAATDLSDDAVAACRFARTMAARLGREAVALHITPALDPVLKAYLAEGPWRELAEQEHAAALARLTAWLDQHGLSDMRADVETGPLLDTVGAVVQRTRAPLLVVGSRRLPTLERAFIGSTAAALAAEMPLPVAVVPQR